MKLLLDQNLSPKLVDRLADLFPGSVHVQSVGLERATDVEVWNHAKVHGLTIATKDDDFEHLSVMHGRPPKVIWLQTGNCSTAELESVFRGRAAEIAAFMSDPAIETLIVR